MNNYWVLGKAVQERKIFCDVVVLKRCRIGGLL